MLIYPIYRSVFFTCTRKQLNLGICISAGTTVQIKPAPSNPGGQNQVQNLKIVQGQGGQIQVQGLLPGKQYRNYLHVLFRVHFVRRTSSPSQDILNSRWTFHCKMSSEYKTFRWTSICRTLSLIYACQTFCPARYNHFAGHFQNSPDMSGESSKFGIFWSFCNIIKVGLLKIFFTNGRFCRCFRGGRELSTFFT